MVTGQSRSRFVLLFESFIFLVVLISTVQAHAAVMNDYCIQPPFISQEVPPLVMFTMDKEHRLFSEAYNDAMDLDGDGRIETTYKHSIDYYGYFDTNKCYTYSTTANEFNPANYSNIVATQVVDGVTVNTYDKFCSAGKWSGNILNWLTMTRMDAIRKVLYGGTRYEQSTNKTGLVRAYVPQDAHAFGKEYTGRLCTDGTSYTNMCATDNDCDSGFSCIDKSINLVGIAAPVAANTCAYTNDIVWTTAGKILVVKYSHTANTVAESGGSHDNLILSYEPANYEKNFYLTDFNVDDVTAANNDTQYFQDHGEHYNYVAVAEFDVPNNKKGVWQFLVDGDDAVELYVDGAPIASRYGPIDPCIDATASNIDACITTNPTMKGTIDIESSGYHRLIARHSEVSGIYDGIKVWYKRPGDANWSIFGQSANLNLRAPTLPGGAECTIKAIDFINTGQPVKGTVQKYHLFCNKSTTGNVGTGDPLLRVLTDRTERIWDWVSREVVQCGNTIGTNTAVSPTSYTVKVEVCNNAIGLEPNCKAYGCTQSLFDASVCNNLNASLSYRPIGLLQKYGDSDGSKACSKTFAKACNSDSACDAGSNNGVDLGMCVDKSRMLFGMFSGSWTHNLNGGVLRKNVNSISDEVQMDTGAFKTAQSIPSNMVEAIDKFRIIDYTDSSQSYGNCVSHNQNIVDGKCTNWGNPLAETMYESLRYFAGKGVPLSDYDYPQNQQDGGALDLPHPAYWGYRDGSRNFKGPYDIFPSCSKPFLLVLSDTYPSFDADKLPGVVNSAFTEDTTVHPVLNLDRNFGGKKLLTKLLDDISNSEGVNNNSSWFIGKSDTLYDFVCTSKTVTTMSLLRGLCPEQPTRQGSFYSAAIAYYAHSFMHAEIQSDSTAGINKNIPNAQTFAVAVASAMGNMFVKVGNKTIKIVPLGKSISGGGTAAGAGTSIYNTCASKCTLGTDARGSLTITNCAADAVCPTDEIVKVYMESIKYDAANNPVYLRFRINFADAEQGQDFDMDAVGFYEVCTQQAIDAHYGTCSGDLSPDPVTLNPRVEVKVVSDYAAGGIDQALGFVISGTDQDGQYLVVRDKTVSSCPADADTPAAVCALPFNYSRVFTATGTTTNFLHDPLWYAAKWGGFIDKNGNDIPDQRAEWAANCPSTTDISKCDPDNYFPVTNPLFLERQLEAAFKAILARVSSGTAASILNNSEGSGANLLQAVFYPKKSFDEGTEANWIGEIQNLWYYLDPGLQKTSIREDTNQDYTLHLKNDKIAAFYFDPSDSITKVKLFSDANGDGSADNPAVPDATVTPDDVNSLWKAGRLLWGRDLTASPRTIYTGYNSSINTTPQILSSLATTSAFQDVLQIPGPDGATRNAATTALINFVHGTDQTGMRGRKVTLLECGLANCTREWKLGDIVSSTPKLISNVKLNNYSLSPPTGYGDNTYARFITSATYRNRGMVFVGGNDGMLHAFKLGVLQELTDRYAKAKMTSTYGGATATAADLLGNEEWAFIPQHTVPYLKYLADPAYSHLYYVDKTPSTLDASIGVNTADTSAACAADYSQCTKAVDGSTWRTVLIGGMGIGGAVKATSDACTAPANCVKTPIADYGYSSYFALDVTDPTAPKYLWEIAPSGLGYTTTGPALVRISAKREDGVTPDNSKNGKWFAVFASGPTGPIDTTLHEFKGQSDQNLKIFIVDLATGVIARTIDTGITNAFAGSLASSWIDTDRSNTASAGYYSDDAVYIGYVKKDTTTNTWTKGGVLRLLTKESTEPDSADANKKWAWSTLIDDTGPVTTSITKLQDRRNKNLWIYFGTGRFFYKADDNAATSQNVLYGVKEPCYSTLTGPTNDIDKTCTSSASSGLINQSGDTPSSTIAATAPGWYINLDAPDSSYLAERMITDPIASPAGAVFFTTFKPSADICKFGGDSFIWGVNYATGGQPPAASVQGRALMQVSTGAFAEINLSTALTDKGNRKTHTPISGVPPTAQGLSLITNPPPVKKFLHVKEK